MEEKLQTQELSQGPMHLASKISELQNYIDQQQTYHNNTKEELMDKNNKFAELESINIDLMVYIYIYIYIND